MYKPKLRKPDEELELFIHIERLVDYDHLTGIFTWKYRQGDCVYTKRFNNNKAGKVINSNSSGYLFLETVFKKKQIVVLLHRLAWYLINKEVPNGLIDHINHKRDDNRICNLRVVDHSENMKNQSMNKNNKSGFTGVRWIESRNKWEARVTLNNKINFLGLFDSVEDASKSVDKFRKENGFHPNHGKNITNDTTN